MVIFIVLALIFFNPVVSLFNLSKRKNPYVSIFNWNWWRFLIHRSIQRRCSITKDVLKNFAKFRGKYLCQSFLLNKVTGMRPATLLKKRLSQRCFPVNFAKLLRTPFLQSNFGRLLLNPQYWSSHTRIYRRTTFPKIIKIPQNTSQFFFNIIENFDKIALFKIT